jgi:hypothetical protein
MTFWKCNNFHMSQRKRSETEVAENYCWATKQTTVFKVRGCLCLDYCWPPPVCTTCDWNRLYCHREWLLPISGSDCMTAGLHLHNIFSPHIQRCAHNLSTYSMKQNPVEMWWHTVTQVWGSKGETGKRSVLLVHFTLPRNMLYSALLPLMCTPLLPAVDWTDAHRPNKMKSSVWLQTKKSRFTARVPSHFKCSLPHHLLVHSDSHAQSANVNNMPDRRG